MIYKEDYTISFVSLSEGEHYYNYNIDKSFFADIEYSPIKESSVDVAVTLIKHRNFLDLHFELKGTVQLPCDRCLELFNLPINNQFQLIIKFEEDPVPVEDQDKTEIQYIDTSTTEINVAQPIYEYINLSLPIKRIHPNDNCNNAVIEKLEELSPNASDKDDIDPRWEKLKQLKQKHYGSS